MSVMCQDLLLVLPSLLAYGPGSNKYHEELARIDNCRFDESLSTVTVHL